MWENTVGLTTAGQCGYLPGLCTFSKQPGRFCCVARFENPWARTFLHFYDGPFLGWHVVTGRARTRAHILMDDILYQQLQESFVLLWPQRLRRTKNGMRNSGCIPVGKHFSSLFGKNPVWQPPLLSKIPSTAWHSWLWGREQGQGTQM